MILGGETDKSVITYDPTTSAYTFGPDMLNDHENFGCAHFESDAHFGRPVVLAAGGSRCVEKHFFSFFLITFFSRENLFLLCRKAFFLWLR